MLNHMPVRVFRGLPLMMTSLLARAASRGEDYGDHKPGLICKIFSNENWFSISRLVFGSRSLKITMF